MRYLKPAAFLMLMVGSSMPLLSQVAIAAPEDASSEGLDPDLGSLSDGQSASSQSLAQSNDTTPGAADLVAILDSAQGNADKALLYSQLIESEALAVPPIVSAVRSPQFTRLRVSDRPLSMVAVSPLAAEAASSDASAPQDLREPSLQLAQQPVGTKVLTLEALRELVESTAQTDDTLSESDAVPVPVQAAPEQDAAAQTAAGESPEIAQEDTTDQEAPADGDLPTLLDPVPDDNESDDNESSETPVDDAPTVPPETQPIDGDDAQSPVQPAADTSPDGASSDGASPDGASPDGASPDGASPIGTNAEISELPDILFADPNPLNVPVSPEEVELDKTPVITLEQAVELAYRNNQALQGALLALEQAEAVAREANAARLPSVTVNSDLSAQLSDGDTRSDLGADLRVDYNLITGGSRAASIRAAELQRQVSALAVEAQQEQIRLTTANAYYALQEAGEQIRIQQAFVAEAERNLRDARLRQEVGVGTRFDVLRAEVQFANARQSSIQSQSDQQVASRDIARLLNLPPTAGIQATPVAVAEDWPLTLEDSIVLATQNRAELEQQLLQADISEEQRKIALAAIRPQLSLFANFGVDSVLSGGNAFTDDFQEASTIGARFSMSLFDGGAARAQARQRALDGEIAEQQFSENADQIRFDVEQSFFNLVANKENITTSEIAVAQAQEALSLANLRLQAGVGTQLDVLTAQSELTQAESNNVTAILGYNRALAAMQRAVSNLGLFSQ